MRIRNNKLVALALIASFSFSLVACNSTSENNNVVSNDTEQTSEIVQTTEAESETEEELSIFDGENELFNIFYDIDKDGEEETVKCTNRGDEQSHLEIYEAEQITEHIGIPGWKCDNKYLDISIMMINDVPHLVVYGRFGFFNVEERLAVVSYDDASESFNTELCLVSIQEGNTTSLYELYDVQKCDTAQQSGRCLSSADMTVTEEAQAYDEAYNTAIETLGFTRVEKDGVKIVVAPSDVETLFQSNLVVK